jgi:hypothetical protein
MTKLNMYVALNFVYLNSTLNTTQCQQEYTMNLQECFARIMTKNSIKIKMFLELIFFGVGNVRPVSGRCFPTPLRPHRP